MSLVLDASVAVSWAFADEGHPMASAARERLRSEKASAPALWWFEVRNALLVSERRGRPQEDDTKVFLADLATVGVSIDQSSDENVIYQFARRHRLTFYAAAYLELARRPDSPLATLDKKLAAAALAENIPLLQAP